MTLLDRIVRSLFGGLAVLDLAIGCYAGIGGSPLFAIFAGFVAALMILKYRHWN